MTARTCHRPGCWAPATTTEIVQVGALRVPRGVCRPGSCASPGLATVSTVPATTLQQQAGRVSGAKGGRRSLPRLRGRTTPRSISWRLLDRMVSDGDLSAETVSAMLRSTRRAASSALSRLVYAGWAIRPARGVYRITEQGRAVWAAARREG